MQSVFDFPVKSDSIEKSFGLVGEHATAAHVIDFLNRPRATMLAPQEINFTGDLHRRLRRRAAERFGRGWDAADATLFVTPAIYFFAHGGNAQGQRDAAGRRGEGRPACTDAEDFVGFEFPARAGVMMDLRRLVPPGF